ncbi:hypothetical protein FAGAP_7004 [Fusarium agapanthi]|uniref:Uncharacterized protein n=1 Tax=Fusarium agapanthi TaxID=1803897 RepID=A0A9P5EBJ2_9HYPO|nr:hypothetical protein FAGAP_7004 [Fusarium agapanthi]
MAGYNIDLIDVPICDLLDEPDGVKGYVRMVYQTMKKSASIRQLFFTAVLSAGIVVDSTGLEFMAGQNFCPWLQLTQPLECGEGSDIEMSFATSEASSEVFTPQHSMTSSFGMEIESGLSTPIPLFPTYDSGSQRLSFAEALHLTQILDHDKETADNFNTETQPQYCSLDMLSNKNFPSRQGPVDKTEDFALFAGSETNRYYGKDSPDRLSRKKVIGPTSALLLTYGIGDHFEPLQSVEEDLPSSREQSIPLGPTETCIDDEEGSPCPSMVESDDSSVEDIELRKAFACPYFRLDPVRHIECLSRKLYRIQDVKQHLSRRHYIKRDNSDNTRGVNPRTQKVLKLRLDRRLSPEGQWHEIWRTLFNGTLPREGPYLGNSKEEIVGSMIATEKASTGSGVDSIPMTPKDMEFEFDFNVPLHRSPSPEIQNSYSSKDITQIQESNSVIPTGLPDYTTFDRNMEDDILTGYQSPKRLTADAQAKPAWTPHTALGTLKKVENLETAGATSNGKPDGKSLRDWAPVFDNGKHPGSWEKVSRLLWFSLQDMG